MPESVLQITHRGVDVSGHGGGLYLFMLWKDSSSPILLYVPSHILPFISVFLFCDVFFSSVLRCVYVCVCD